MIAISVLKRTIYDCNPIQKGPNMIAKIENLFSRDLSRNHSYVTLGQFSTLQSYLVPIGKDCNHIMQSWSVLEFRLQSYLVPVVKTIAITSGTAQTSKRTNKIALLFF